MNALHQYSLGHWWFEFDSYFFCVCCLCLCTREVGIIMLYFQRNSWVRLKEFRAWAQEWYLNWAETTGWNPSWVTSLLLRLRWAYWDMSLRQGWENWSHTCSALTQNILGRNVGVLWVSWRFLFVYFFLPGDIFYDDAVRGNLSSHAPLESKYLMFSYINYNSVLDSLEKRFIY